MIGVRACHEGVIVRVFLYEIRFDAAGSDNMPQEGGLLNEEFTFGGFGSEIILFQQPEDSADMMCMLIQCLGMDKDFIDEVNHKGTVGANDV